MVDLATILAPLSAVVVKEQTSWLSVRKGNRRRDCRASATALCFLILAERWAIDEQAQSQVPEKKKETKRIVDRGPVYFSATCANFFLYV